VQVQQSAREMAAVDSDESDFGDDMALVARMKAHTGSQGLGAACAPVAAVPIKKVAAQREDAAAALLTERMLVVRQYDLNTAAGIDKFAQEIILQRTPEHMNADFGAMTPEDARDVRKVHTEHCVDFLISWRCTEQVQPLLWEHGVRPCAARRCRFQMARGARTSRSSSSQGRGARARRGKRHVQDQVAWCRQHGTIQLIVHSHLCKLTHSWYVAPHITPGAYVHATARANAR